MGEPVGGLWLRNNQQVPYIGASKWGTGINPVHALRMGEARNRGPGLAEIIPASEATSGFVETKAPWGYNPNDLAGLDVFASEYQAINGVYFDPDDRPVWGEDTTQTRAEVPQDSSRPWGSSGGYNNILRSVKTGPGNINMVGSGFSYEIPTETVSEGWVNKAASGMGDGQVADSEPADNSQVFVQTSETQRYKTQNNQRAVARDTDDEREPIDSRIAPMKLKIYSGEERHIDMFPYQIDQMPRPFWYRTAGVGRAGEMEPNEMYVITSVQRTPPPDPSMGPEDTDLSENSGGYTDEDTGWY